MKHQWNTILSLSVIGMMMHSQFCYDQTIPCVWMILISVHKHIFLHFEPLNLGFVQSQFRNFYTVGFTEHCQYIHVRSVYSIYSIMVHKSFFFFPLIDHTGKVCIYVLHSSPQRNTFTCNFGCNSILTLISAYILQ